MNTLPPESSSSAPFTAVEARRIDAAFHRAFPEDFRWGVASSAYQIEGAVREDGRGPSIWDTFCELPGKIRDGNSGRVACDHYHRYPEDVALMRRLGIRNYRLSVSWPRIFPDGAGKPNPRGLEFYDRLIDELVNSGITPLVTLYHWDLPQALEDRGGWRSREIAPVFADYAATVVRRLGDRVKTWVTHNEPWCTAVLGHETGQHAPGMRDRRSALVAAHHALLGHATAMEALRAEGAERVGITLNLDHFYPATERAPDREAVRRVEARQTRWFLDPVLTGRYPEVIGEELEPLEVVRAGDLARIAQRVDFLGVNYYSARLVQADPAQGPEQARIVPPGDRVTAMGWPVVPEGLRDLLLKLHEAYPPVPIIVTENGAAYQDRLDGGAVDDVERETYLREHLLALAEAVRAGVDVRGYYLWTLMDNFEWDDGYTKRFGIVYTDPGSAPRIPKRSAHFYSRIARGLAE